MPIVKRLLYQSKSCHARLCSPFVSIDFVIVAKELRLPLFIYFDCYYNKFENGLCISGCNTNKYDNVLITCIFRHEPMDIYFHLVTRLYVSVDMGLSIWFNPDCYCET